MVEAPTVGFLVNDVARLMRKRFEQRARGQSLTRAQWQTLAMLSKHDGIKQRQLAELLEIEPITLTRILDRLAEQKLIDRRAHPTDRRAQLVFISGDAAPLIKDMRKLGAQTRAEALQDISATEQEQLMHLLAKMKENLAQACRNPIANED